jgi:predicted ATPase/transcriptional regulator with XRE-family HTH domain
MKEDRKVRMETFGEWLHEQRRLRRLTRDEFAKRIGCSVSALRKIEYGARRPSAQIAELMANCLDVPPEERSTFVRVARGELSVARLLPKSRLITAMNVSSPKTNLPVFPTPLIGREREVEQLSQLLCDPQCRLLTLVGPGGIGKTRLAIETALRMQDVSADGVYFVPLASANSTRFIVPVIADSIGFAFHHASRADPKTQLFGYLKEKQALLLTDNLEQLLTEPDMEVFTELLAHAPRMKLLATSRESLGLQDEWVFEVEGLPVPETISTEESAQNTCVELFLQRARRAHIGYNFTIQDYPSILRICQLVDGNPLGIELAAAWVRTLSCGEIAREIERGLGFLAISTRDIPARHRSMRAIFDHSWKLLTDEEQRILLRLSVFRGGFRREAAEQVAGATLSVLSSLVTKSLIRRSGTGRYDLHELIRQFAAEQFGGLPDEQSAAQTRHSQYYLRVFSQADVRLRSAAQREALTELTAEMDNFRSAWDWAVTYSEFALMEQTLRTFWLLYDARGWFQEGLDMLGCAVDALEMAHGSLPPDRTNQVALGHLLATRAWLAYRLAHYEQAQAMLERSVAILCPLNEPRVLVHSISYLGNLMEVTGNYARALQLYSEGLEMATAVGDRWYVTLFLTNLNGLIASTHVSDKYENAHEGLRSAVADWRIIGDPRFTAFGLRLLSNSALALGRYDEARAVLEESAALNRSVGDRWGLSSVYRGLGIVAQALGQHQEAVVMFGKSLDTISELGGSWWVARVLADMSRSVFVLGNHAEARRVWRESLRIATEIHATPVVLEVLASFASLQAEPDNMEHTLELLLIVLNHPASLQETKNRADRLRAELQARLTPTQIEAVQSHAAEKSFEAVVEDLLK